MTSFVNVNKRLSSFKWKQSILILCGNNVEHTVIVFQNLLFCWDR